jgi:1-acyl-sn-glycerol-3-phosphate acyltransferase
MPVPPLPDPPSLNSRLWGNLRAAVALSALFPTLFLFNGLQTLSLLLLPLSPRVFRAFNRWCADTWWGWCDVIGERVYGIRVITTGDDLPMRENAVVVANHQQMTDIPVLFRLARTKGRLGDMKWFVKDVLKYVPGVGWGMLFLDCIFIKRDWLKDRVRIDRAFASLVNHRVPAWLVTFVEGTRIRLSKLDASQRYAAEHGLPVLAHLLTPRSKGFVATVQALGGHFTAVYDVTIGYVGGVPTLMQWAKGYVRTVHLHARRYALADLPHDDEALTAWLHARFQEKDRLLDHFYRQGEFQDVEVGRA